MEERNMLYILVPLKVHFHVALGPMHYVADPRRELAVLLLWSRQGPESEESNDIFSVCIRSPESHRLDSYATSRMLLCTLGYI